MITVKETSPGVFERIAGNPTLDSLDGTMRAPLHTIRHESWTAKDRAKFGIYVVEPFAVPDGKRAVGAPRYERQAGKVIEVRDVVDHVPPPEPTPREKVESLLQGVGLTVDEFRKVLAETEFAR